MPNISFDLTLILIEVFNYKKITLVYLTISKFFYCWNKIWNNLQKNPTRRGFPNFQN